MKHGEDLVKLWRRSYDIPPPALDKNDERYALFDERYSDLPVECIPLTECLKDTVNRAIPFW
jgi:2,3-bisphosphoglycerate-dependent phosphoglycerate mutase